MKRELERVKPVTTNMAIFLTRTSEQASIRRGGSAQKKMVDFTGATEGQVKREQSLRKSIKEAKHIGECNERDANAAGHPGTVVQRAANGHIVVQGH